METYLLETVRDKFIAVSLLFGDIIDLQAATEEEARNHAEHRGIALIN